MTNAEQPRRPSPAERLTRFRIESPAAGEEFPDIQSVTLQGDAWNLEALRGRVVVLETGAFT